MRELQQQLKIAMIIPLMSLTIAVSIGLFYLEKNLCIKNARAFIQT